MVFHQFYCFEMINLFNSQVCWKDYLGITHWRPKNRAALILKILEAVTGRTELTQNVWSMLMLTVLMRAIYILNDIIGFMDMNPGTKRMTGMNVKIPSVFWNVSEFFQMPVDLLEQMSYSSSYLFDHTEGIMLGVSFMYMLSDWGECDCSQPINDLIALFCAVLK